MPEKSCAKIEWPTLAMLAVSYILWGGAVVWASAVWLPAAMVLVALAAAQHSSLCHEALHGHPTRVKWLNEALVFPQLTLFIPYGRFRDMHLEHHHDERLTDPYDDPESNYYDPKAWAQMAPWLRAVMRLNNTLAGRMLLGPLIGQIYFMRADWQSIRAGDSSVLYAWLLHVPAVLSVLWFWAVWGSMPLWALLLATYASLSVLKIRTFLEHRAHEDAKGRTVVVEDRGLLALLFLNNNLHVVHHERPGVPWYRLPALFRAERAAFLGQNDGYYYRSYGEVFRAHFFKAKDPVPHPLWPKE